jgi:hypothetical protein
VTASVASAGGDGCRGGRRQDGGEVVVEARAAGGAAGVGDGERGQAESLGCEGGRGQLMQLVLVLVLWLRLRLGWGWG